MQYKVLIVEDDEDTAAIEAIGLKRLNFDVAVVHHGDEAIPKMREWKPDAVVLDLELPGKNGFQIMQEMLLDPVLRNLILIANTVHMDAKDDLGFSYYAHYQRSKGQEPIMINKMAKDQGSHLDLSFVVVSMIGQKFGALTPQMIEWLEKKGPPGSRPSMG